MNSDVYKMRNPFRITIEHYDEKVSIEIDHSDISNEELCQLFYKIGQAAGFAESNLRHIVEENE